MHQGLKRLFRHDEDSFIVVDELTFEPPLAEVYQPSKVYPFLVGVGNVPY